MSVECHYSYELEHFFVFIHRNKDIAGGLEDAGKTEGLLGGGGLHRNRDTSILRRCTSGASPHTPTRPHAFNIRKHGAWLKASLTLN